MPSTRPILGAFAFALGLLVLSLERTFTPERVYPWLGVGSGLVALALGAGLLVQRLGALGDVRATREREPTAHAALAHAADAHGDAHDHAADGDDAAHGHGHVHAVPDAPVLSRRGLTAVAVAGGILPSPTALVVLLSAVSFHRVAFGLSLIAMFSIGLAGALIVVGVAALRARDVVSARLTGSLGRWVPIASAGVIAAVGLFLTLRGVAQL
jgi:ABC-type nickel/cobalt efflux system permease component RcnA